MLLVSVPAYSQDETLTKTTFLCIAEEISQITNNGNKSFSSASGKFSKKYLITPGKGLREFGKDYSWLESCSFSKEGVPTWCDSGSDGWAGEFLMNKDNTFVLSGVWAGFEDNKDKKVYFWVIGSCSRL